ncbi:MAG: hypothetical protein RMI04_09550 [Thermofilaceae archaeon]|nr:hypothetical protein [Thermofilaceae archaeon]
MVRVVTSPASFKRDILTTTILLQDERTVSPGANPIIHTSLVPGEVEYIEFFGSGPEGGSPSHIEYTLIIDERTFTFNPYLVNFYINESYAAFFTVKRYQESPPLWLIALSGKIRFSTQFRIEVRNVHSVYSYSLKTRGRILRYRVF